LGNARLARSDALNLGNLNSSLFNESELNDWLMLDLIHAAQLLMLAFIRSEVIGSFELSNDMGAFLNEDESDLFSSKSDESESKSLCNSNS
jgi:hypothetical protein